MLQVQTFGFPMICKEEEENPSFWQGAVRDSATALSGVSERVPDVRAAGPHAPGAPCVSRTTLNQLVWNVRSQEMYSACRGLFGNSVFFGAKANCMWKKCIWTFCHLIVCRNWCEIWVCFLWSLVSASHLSLFELLSNITFNVKGVTSKVTRGC